MRIKFLAAAAFMTAVAAPAVAADAAKPVVKPIAPPPAPAVVLGHSGDISFYGGWMASHIVEEGGDEIQNWNGSLYGGLARMNWWLGPKTNAQLEFSAEHWSTNETASGTQWDGAVHLDWAHPNGALVGGFVSIGRNTDFDAPATFATVALEAQTRTSWPALTLYGQVGFSTSVGGGGDDTVDGPMRGGYLHIAGLYALSPNANLGVDFGYAFLNVDESPLNILRWGATLDFTLPNHPLNVFVSYQGHHDNIIESGNVVTVHALLAGVKLRFGMDTVAPMRVDYNPFTGVNNPRDAF
jgi:opacity protein-like surface antigen